MLHQHEYVNEKLRQLETEALARGAAVADTPRRATRPVVGPLAVVTGSLIRRFGASIEGWGAPAIPVTAEVTPEATPPPLP